MAGRLVETRPQICRVRCRTRQEDERRGGTVNGSRRGGKGGIWSASTSPSVFRCATARSSVRLGSSAAVGGVMESGAGLVFRRSKLPRRGLNIQGKKRAGRSSQMATTRKETRLKITTVGCRTTGLEPGVPTEPSKRKPLSPVWTGTGEGQGER